MSILKDRQFIRFVVKFLLLFGLFYLGTLAVIGLATPGGIYTPFVEKYFDYVSWIKQSLSWGARKVVSMAGYSTTMLPDYTIRTENGALIKIAMNCVGYGVYSFWAAYIIANHGSFIKKLVWVVGGLLTLWLINVLRIGFFLLALQQRKEMPLGIDHHTWFNIVAYLFIFGMIWLYEKQQRKTTLSA
ncbi:MAG: exosortase/archaeosortase family protein [Ferruginibacter sp.]